MLCFNSIMEYFKVLKSKSLHHYPSIIISAWSSCAMCDRLHFLFQKYSFSSKHMSTKLEGSPSTRNDCRTHHITTTTSGRLCYPQLLLDWSRMLSTMSDKYNKYFFISINCRLSPFHGYLSTLIQLTEYVLNINRRLTGTGYVNKLRIRKDKR